MKKIKHSEWQEIDLTLEDHPYMGMSPQIRQYSWMIRIPKNCRKIIINGSQIEAEKPIYSLCFETLEE